MSSAGGEGDQLAAPREEIRLAGECTLVVRRVIAPPMLGLVNVTVRR